MKALSIKNPWGRAIVKGWKPVENRDWPTNFRGQFLIHVGKKDAGVDAHRFIREHAPRLDLRDLEYGGIIGIAEIYDCVQASASPWFFGPYGFLIRRARRLPFYPFRGQLGFFEAHHPEICDIYGEMR